jgi:6,7-dimethyl-8-ribityllumazine synthase
MATSDKNLSQFDEIPSGKRFRIGIVAAEWNREVTDKLLEAAVETLEKAGVQKIHVLRVPGTFELPFGAQSLAQKKQVDAVIALGCVVQGETRHFDFICDATANGIMRVALDYNKPVIFGVLTTANQEQALERAGGKHGNKGTEAAVTALKMLSL